MATRDEIIRRASLSYKPFTTPQVKPDEPWWQDVLNFVARPQRAVTGALANITDNNKDTTFLSGVLGGLSGRERKDFDEFLNNVGWKQNEADGKYSFLKGQKGKFDLFDMVNFLGNVGLDPITYLSFGAAALPKAGASAMGKVALQQAAKYGAKASGTPWLKGSAKRLAADTPDLIENTLLKKGISADQAANASRLARIEIDNAGKAARLKAQNNLINLDVPFTNISKGFGKKPSFLRLTDRSVTPEMVAGITSMLQKINDSVTPDEITKVIQGRYGKDDLAKLTMQEANDIQQLTKMSYDSNPSAKTYSEQVMDFFDNSKFQQGSGGVSKLGSLLTPLNPFNSRTVFGNKNPLINRSANFYTDTKNRILSRTRQVEKDMVKASQLAKGLSDEEKKAVAYIIEKQFPNKFTDLDNYLTNVSGNTKNKQKIQDLADFVSERMKKYTDQEVEVGLRSNTLDNYFPHIQDFEAQELAGLREVYQKNLNDPVIGRFIAQSSNNPYAQTRKSFKTLAEVDDKIAELKDQLLTTAKGTNDYNEIDEKIRLLEVLFKRDPANVLEQRSKTAVRSSAMKALQDQYILDGAIVKTSGRLTEEQSKSGLRKMRPEEIDAIGLANTIRKEKGENIFIHEELYKLLSESTRYFEQESLNRTVELVNSATNIFKSLYTSAVPKHYWYNFVGSVFNNTMAGVTVGSYVKAGKLLASMRNKRLTPKEEKLINFAFDEGILNQTAFADLVRPDIMLRGRKVKTKDELFYRRIDKFNKTVVDNPLSMTMRNYLGDPSDNLTRLAHYIHVYETTRSVKLAAESVRLHLFNYNELTNADRITKVIFPFWNWMKNNVPLQLHKMFTEPRIAQQFQRIQEESFGEDTSGNYPDYIKEMFVKLPTGKDEFYSPRLPLQDLGQFGNSFNPLGIAESGMKTGLNSLTPVAKIPLELYFNKQIFSDRPVSFQKFYSPQRNYLEGQRSVEEVLKYLSNNTGVLGDAYEAQKQLRDPEEDKTWVDILTNNLFGNRTKLQ